MMTWAAALTLTVLDAAGVLHLTAGALIALGVGMCVALATQGKGSRGGKAPKPRGIASYTWVEDDT